MTDEHHKLLLLESSTQSEVYASDIERLAEYLSGSRLVNEYPALAEKAQQLLVLARSVRMDLRTVNIKARTDAGIYDAAWSTRVAQSAAFLAAPSADAVRGSEEA